MANNGKPPKLTEIIPGKSLGANVHKGLTETLNWVVRFCNNLTGDGQFIEVQNPLGDHPMITFGYKIPGYGGLGGGLPPKPFDYIYNDVESGDGGYKIVRNRFYYNGVYHEIDDYDVTYAGGTIYLKCDFSTTDPEFSIVTSNESSEKVYCYKLYDLDNGQVTCDYRDTFLTIGGKGGNDVEVDDISIDWLEPESDSDDPAKLEIWHFNEPQTADKDVYEIPDSAESEPEEEHKYRFLARYENNGSYGLKYVDIFKKDESGGGSIGKGVNEPVFDSNGNITGIKNVMIQWERRFLTHPDFSVSISSGYIYLKVQHPAANAPITYPQDNDIELDLTQSSEFNLNNTDTQTLIPLFKVEDSKITVDYRNIPCIPVYR